MGGARVEACAGFDVRVPFAEAWRAQFRAVLDFIEPICVPCSAYIGTFNAFEIGFDVCKHRSAKPASVPSRGSILRKLTVWRREYSGWPLILW